MNIYIKEQGIYLKKKGDRIAVLKDDETIQELLIKNIDNVILLGNVQLSTQVITMLLQNGIDISYMSRNGRFIGSTHSGESKNIFLKMAQYDRYKDFEYRISLAKNIIKSKTKNQINLIRRHNWGNEDETWKDDVDKMLSILETVDSKNTTNSLMGIEGVCSGIYFSNFAKMIKDSSFIKRERPAAEPVNALLNLGYTFLTNEIASLLEASSFEVCLGFLHGVRYGRKSLALDIVEEFRQPIIDRFIISILNRKILNKDDFELINGEIHLNESAFKVFCSQYEDYINKKENKEYSLRETMDIQISKLREALMTGEVYYPFEMRI